MNYQSLYEMLATNAMPEWRTELESQLNRYFANPKHGDYPRWQSALDRLPDIKPSGCVFDIDSVTIGKHDDCSDVSREQLRELLREFMPWRKGPFHLFGINIDCEWRSNLKWQRLQQHIRPLNGKLVLDIGSGNGYYAWRMLGDGARYVVGIDPTLLFVMQFQVLKKYWPSAPIDILPLGIQHLPVGRSGFDTVFSMGVLYHRRDHMEHLHQLRQTLKPGGELVLETLVLNEESNNILRPDGRYAKMNNVHAIPGLALLQQWVEEAGYRNVRIVDVSVTTTDEQRATDWMQFESLPDFLDKQDRTKTIEGYPAPVRAIVLADATT